jgi:hypothetical protein
MEFRPHQYQGYLILFLDCSSAQSAGLRLLTSILISPGLLTASPGRAGNTLEVEHVTHNTDRSP